MCSNVHHTKVLPLSLSDHDCVISVRKISHRNMPFRTITCRDYSKYNHTVLAGNIEIMTGTQSIQKQMLTLHSITWNKDSLLSSTGMPPKLENV